MSATDRAPRWRAQCRTCDWTIDGPVEQWARLAAYDHRRRAHGPKRRTHDELYRWRGNANATQLRLLTLAAAGSLACTSCHIWTPDGDGIEWYAARVTRAEGSWTWGLTKAGLLRVRRTWQSYGIYIPTPAGHRVLAANERT